MSARIVHGHHHAAAAPGFIGEEHTAVEVVDRAPRRDRSLRPAHGRSPRHAACACNRWRASPRWPRDRDADPRRHAPGSRRRRPVGGRCDLDDRGPRHHPQRARRGRRQIRILQLWIRLPRATAAWRRASRSFQAPSRPVRREPGVWPPLQRHRRRRATRRRATASRSRSIDSRSSPARGHAGAAALVQRLRVRRRRRRDDRRRRRSATGDGRLDRSSRRARAGARSRSLPARAARAWCCTPATAARIPRSPRPVRRGLAARDPRAVPPVPRRRFPTDERGRSPSKEHSNEVLDGSTTDSQSDVPAERPRGLAGGVRGRARRADELLAQAANSLYRATDLECADVRELVGLI